MLQAKFTMTTGDEVFDMDKQCKFEGAFDNIDDTRKGNGNRDAKGRKE